MKPLQDCEICTLQYYTVFQLLSIKSISFEKQNCLTNQFLGWLKGSDETVESHLPTGKVKGVGAIVAGGMACR